MKTRWAQQFWIGLLAGVALICTGCLGPKGGLFPPAPGAPTKTVYIVSHGWHAGLVLNKADVPPSLLPEKADFPEAKYLDLSWGANRYFRASHATVGMLLEAIFGLDGSVILVVAFSEPVAQYYSSGEIIRVELSQAGFVKMCQYLNDQFKRDSMARSPPLQPGFEAHSYFYEAKGRYYFPKTCNVWTAQALRAAGCPITPVYAVNVGDLMFQLRRFGTQIRR